MLVYRYVSALLPRSISTGWVDLNGFSDLDEDLRNRYFAAGNPARIGIAG